jgi:hypothetical protein
MVSISLGLLIYWFLPSLIAAMGIMAASEMVKHKLEFKRALLMGLIANFLPGMMDTFYEQISNFIPYGSIKIGNITLASIVINIIIWVRLSTLIMENGIVDRIKIGIIGFSITNILILFNIFLLSIF